LKIFLDSIGGGAWPFLVGGVICLVNSVNERDLDLLNSLVNSPGGKAPASAIDLVSQFLRYEPGQRLDPFEALCHPFFDELREPNARLPNGKPLPQLFNFTEGELKLADKKNLTLKLIPPHLLHKFGYTANNKSGMPVVPIPAYPPPSSASSGAPASPTASGSSSPTSNPSGLKDNAVPGAIPGAINMNGVVPGPVGPNGSGDSSPPSISP